MNLRLQKNRWHLMLAVNAAVLIGVFVYKITREPYVPYIHLLVDYHFGFTKRALIGAVVSLFFSKVPVWLVFALSGAVWLITLALFIKLFRKTFGFDDEHLPLRVFVAGSPFFVKNFMHTLGHFDIYGCAFAIALLLVPARSVGSVISAALASMILIHQIHVLMYVPTIAVTNLLSFSYIWYQPLGKEIGDTWDRMPSNLLGVPVFALLVWLHSPLWRYFVSLIRSLSDQFHRRVVIAGIVAVSLAYLILFAIVFDYSRWISNWAICMLLILHAVKNLPSTKPVPPISPKDRKTAILGWIVTLVPRVGIVRPF